MAKKPRVKKPAKPTEEQPAYIIVEKVDGKVHVYRETAAHYAVTEPDRQRDGSRRLPPELLDFECDLSCYGSGVYFVFPIF